MSDPTYRIDIEHSPGDSIPYLARIHRLSDDQHVKSCAGHNAEAVIGTAQAWIAAQHVKQPGVSLYVDDDGRPVEGHSVKA